MSRTKMRLIVAAAALLIALAFVGMGTYAWVTMATQDEVSGLGFSFSGVGDEWPFEISIESRGGIYAKEVSVADIFDNDYLLRPISTFDGEHWFAARYDAFGNLSGYREVELNQVSNIPSAEEVNAEQAGLEEVTSGTLNYLIRQDLWVRTNDQKATGEPGAYYYQLKLNNPRLSNLDDNETEFGTYVLPAPRKNTDPAVWYIDSQDENALKCLRIGFLIYEEDSETEAESFYIYEPFADKRAGDAATDFSSDRIYTQDENGEVRVDSYTSVQDDVIINTLLPTYEDGSIILTSAAIQSAAVGGPNNKTIRQYASSWNTVSLSALSTNENYNSRYLGEIGQFISLDGQADGAGYEGINTPPMANIRYDHPRKVSVFIWLEGQDIDCWNHIWGNSIIANIEFRGDQVTTGSMSN